MSPNKGGKGAFSLAYTKTLRIYFDDNKIGYMNKNTKGRNCDAHLGQLLIYALIDFHTFMSFSHNKARERKSYIIYQHSQIFAFCYASLDLQGQ